MTLHDNRLHSTFCLCTIKNISKEINESKKSKAACRIASWFFFWSSWALKFFSNLFNLSNRLQVYLSSRLINLTKWLPHTGTDSSFSSAIKTNCWSDTEHGFLKQRSNTSAPFPLVHSGHGFRQATEPFFEHSGKNYWFIEKFFDTVKHTIIYCSTIK